MQLCQVLNEEQRQERFAASIQRKRALDDGGDEESDDDVREEPEDQNNQDSRLPPPEEAVALLAPKEDPILFESISSKTLGNLTLSTSKAVPRHLCSPPPLMSNDNSAFRFTLPSNLLFPNPQTAFTQQFQESKKLTWSDGQNPAGNKLAGRDYSTSEAPTKKSPKKNSSSSSSDASPDPPPLSFAREQHNQVNPAAKSTKSTGCYPPFVCNSRLLKSNISSREIPPLVAKPCLNPVTRAPEANHPLVVKREEASVSKWQTGGEQTNVRLLNSSTRYRDLKEKEETSFTCGRTTDQLRNHIVPPESCHSEILLSGTPYEQKQFSKPIMIYEIFIDFCHQRIWNHEIFAINSLSDRYEEYDSSQTNKAVAKTSIIRSIVWKTLFDNKN